MTAKTLIFHLASEEVSTRIINEVPEISRVCLEEISKHTRDISGTSLIILVDTSSRKPNGKSKFLQS